MKVLEHITFGLPMVICILFSAALFIRRNRTREHVILGIAFFLLAVANFTMWCYSAGIWLSSPIMDIISIAASLFSSSVYFLYIKSVSNPKGIEKKHFMIFLPGLFLAGANVVLGFMLGWDDTRGIMRDIMTGMAYSTCTNKLEIIKVVIDSNLFRAVNFTQTVAVVVYGRLCFKRYLDSLSNYYSNKGSVFINPESKLIVCVELMTGTMLLLSIVPFNILIQFPAALGILCVIFSFALVLLGVEGIQITDNARSFAKIMCVVPEVETSAEPETASEKKYIEKIKPGLEAFIKDRGYLNPNITAEDLAAIVNTNRYYLSETLKQLYGCSFSGFINKLRIEYAQTLIESTPKSECSLKGIAIDAGYNNFVNFYRNFVKFSGMNPTEWKSQSKLEIKVEASKD